MKNTIYAVANRNGKALILNGTTNKYKVYNGANSQKASLMAMCELLNKLGEENNTNILATIIVPKNLAFILRINSVYEWVKNGNKTAKGTELDEEFIELAKYISDMRNWLGNRVKVRMTQTDITTSDEELVMKRAWNLLDKETGYKAFGSNNNTNKANKAEKPSMPKFMSMKA